MLPTAWTAFSDAHDLGNPSAHAIHPVYSVRFGTAIVTPLGQQIMNGKAIWRVSPQSGSMSDIFGADGDGQIETYTKRIIIQTVDS